LFVVVDNYDKVIAQGFGVIEVFNMAFVNGIEISGDYDGFFHFFWVLGVRCWVKVFELGNYDFGFTGYSSLWITFDFYAIEQ
jgi:hypothetical protein